MTKDIQARLKEVLGNPDATPEQLAGSALEVAALSDSLLDLLEQVKARLRGQAREALPPGESSVKFEGKCLDSGASLGVVHVTFPQPQVMMEKGVDLGALREALGDKFDRYFETKVVVSPRADIKESVQGISRDPELRREFGLVMSSLSYRESTPRVGFRPASNILDFED